MKLTLREYVNQLNAKRPEVEAKIMEACKNATIRAIEKAAELTPTTQDDLKGTNTRTGEMKERWATDSTIEPIGFASGEVVTVLRNGAQYASYVNDGHRMDRHFVPGLYINEESGMLEYDPAAKVGIVVGTKTKYVPGLHMVDEARKEYQRVLTLELKDIGEVFK